MEDFWKMKLNILDKRIKAFSQDYRQNVVILGDDCEEISALLENYFIENKDPEIIYIHNNTYCLNKKDFFKNVAYSTLIGYSCQNNNLDTLIALSSTNLPGTTEFIKYALKKNTFSLLDSLEVINKFINESKRKCVFIIENFPLLEEIFPSCFKDFSKFIMLQRNCMIVLTSSSIKETQKILSGELNLLFGNFEKILINENTFFDNCSYLRSIIYPHNPSPLFISFFASILGSNTLYYDIMAKCIKDEYKAEDEEAAIISVLTNTTFLKETYFFQRFIGRIDLIKERFKNPASVIKLLIAISEKYSRKNELMSLSLCDNKELNLRLTKLCEYSYIANYGNMYKIQDSLFMFWLANVFKFYFASPAAGAGTRRELWAKAIQEEINNFKAGFFQDNIKKIVELVASFKDDSLRFGKNRYRLPLVEKTKIISYPDKHLYLLIGEGKEIIFAAINEKETQDTDIMDFLQQSNTIKSKGVTKIYISLEKFTAEAQLLAKNHKLATWDIDEINNLLRLYDKPAIPVVAKVANRITDANTSSV